MYPLVYHKHLTPEKWSAYTRGQQVLMIANELNRAKNLLNRGDRSSARLCYERAFERIDLTSEDEKWRGKLKEFRRFRELLAELYLAQDQDVHRLEQLYIALLRLSAEAHRMLYPAVR